MYTPKIRLIDLPMQPYIKSATVETALYKRANYSHGVLVS